MLARAKDMSSPDRIPQKLSTYEDDLARSSGASGYLPGAINDLEEAVRETARLLKERKNKKKKTGRPRVHEPRKWNTLRGNKRIRATP